MAFQALVNSADCGPSTALQNLGKQFDRDRGVQQDLFARPGPSRETFRTPQAPVAPERLQEAAQFFGQQPQLTPHQHVPSRPFDLQAVREALPQLDAARHQQRLGGAPATANWAADFMQASIQPSQHAARMVQSPAAVNATLVPAPQRTLTPLSAYRQTHQIHPMAMHHHSSPLSAQVKGKGRAEFEPSQWENEFMSLASASNDTQQQSKEQPAVEADDLSRVAGMLLDSVRDDPSDKFARSEFMGFMRKLRDREVVVEGEQFVERADPAYSESVSVTTSASAVPAFTPRTRLGPTSTLGQQSFASSSTSTAEQAQQRREVEAESESEIDAYFRRENAEYQQFWAHADASHVVSPEAAAAARWNDPRTAEWDALQREWDNFEATAVGMTPVARSAEDYVFQTDNPYLIGERSRLANAARQDGVHSASAFQAAVYASVLEKEARVQREPGDAQAWYELGVRQQESEREQKAIQALSRAVEIDPSLLPAWMALAVSHCNEGRRDAACNAIEHWVARRLGRKPQPLSPLSSGVRAASPEQHERLVEDLLTIVRSSGADTVDADVQIALAVLFHTTEEYDKALDCFRTALAVRPTDALLYNRVGATLANSGRSEEALGYYARALELAPAYVRAEFNTGIALINLSHFDRQRLEEGAVHLLNALSLQETDSGAGGDGPSVTSAQMWDLLRTCVVRMSRMDLAACCERHDLEGFRAAFAEFYFPRPPSSPEINALFEKVKARSGLESGDASQLTNDQKWNIVYNDERMRWSQERQGTNHLSEDQKWNVYSDERIRSLTADQ